MLSGVEIFKSFVSDHLNELYTVESEPVKIAVVKNLSRFEMK